MGRPKVGTLDVGGKPYAKECPGCKMLRLIEDFARDNTKSDGRTSHCKECRNKYKKRYRSNYKEYKYRRLIPIRPDKCEVCDMECTPEGHHRDYSRPYDVVWVCKKCHTFIHRHVEKVPTTKMDL